MLCAFSFIIKTKGGYMKNEETLLGQLYDNLYGESTSLLNLTGKDNVNAMYDINQTTETSDKKIKNVHGRLENGNLVMDMSNPLLPYGATFSNTAMLQQRLSEYFLSCEGPLKNKNGNIIKDGEGNPHMTQVRPYTLAGMARAMGVETRELKKFASGKYDTVKEKYSYWVKMGAQQIEEYAESRLYDKNGHNGGRFILDSAFGRTIRKDNSDVNSAEFAKQKALLDFSLQLKKLGLDKVDDDLNIVIQPKEYDGAHAILNLDESDYEVTD